MFYTIEQLQNLDSQAVMTGECTQIEYIQGGKYVMECGWTPAQVFVTVQDWKVVLESDGNGFFPVSAHNYMTGTEYKNPMQWFANKVK
tara:strand:- start:14 stop:277 length:264 start_codon:yes stop_codon:yes gene_type:complete